MKRTPGPSSARGSFRYVVAWFLPGSGDPEPRHVRKRTLSEARAFKSRLRFPSAIYRIKMERCHDHP